MPRGIILAGGRGTRLSPATDLINKHLIPILNHPMILYPITTLHNFGITDALVVSGGNHIGGFAEFLGDGRDYGLNLTYKVQHHAGGIAEALGLAEDFSKGEDILVILGDNIFDNEGLSREDFDKNLAYIYIKEVHDPGRFGVVELDKERIVSIEEKPKNPRSNFIATGLYHFPNTVFDVIKTLKPSSRGELEIVDVHNFYMIQGKLLIREVRGFWSDAGTPDSLFEATEWAHKDIHKS